ncbi:hypothetical protein [Micromonospora robiginosa]|uniref:HEAT repeat protein n=1 Tax=Micromonospora robiginosa TaxID=2749844 RepID=A0A7L6B2N8_9ACTN|nr:hypothetical protein [Micromonospora ferruginea]QLQ36242.1 hypothetical protein H1D33_23390 [Micromonospora ferruginea]
MTETQPEGATSAPAAPEGDSGRKAVVEYPAKPDDSSVRVEHRDQPDGRKEDEIPPDSLRLDPRVGEDLYGPYARYSRLSVSGVNALGDNNTIQHITYEGQPAAKPIIRDLVGVPALLEVYSETAACGRLADLLRERSTACLTGRPGTGRFSTACAALAQRHDPLRVHEVLLPDEVGPGALRHATDNLDEDHGYVLRLPGDKHVEAMRSLADVFRQHSASLLLIRDDDLPIDNRHSAEVPHRGPDPLAVFRQHLRHYLRRHAGLDDEEAGRHVETYVQIENLATSIESTYGPREVVPLALAVARRHPAGDDAVAEIVGMSQPRRRKRAAEILRSGATEGERRPRRVDQHERAFRIAYAVFARQPLHYVFEAAGLLLEEIDGQAKRPEWGRMALQYPVSELLGPLDVDWRNGRESVRSQGGVSRSAWLHDGAMRGAIIDEAWHEFDSTRPALLKWLDTLVASDDEAVRHGAAEVAGLLAHHDFDRVCADLIDGWAAAPRPRIREAAARAIVAADMGGYVRHLVRHKVRDWAGGHRNYQRDTAALVYASGLQQPDLSWSLADLRRIAGDRMQQHTWAVAESVYQLYNHSPDQTNQIVLELARWSDDRQLRRHAGNAFLALAENLSSAGPILMTKLAANEVDTAALSRLWEVALLATVPARRAWRILGQWLHEAESDDALRKSIGMLVTDLAAMPALRRRLEFHLVRLDEFQSGLPGWLVNAIRGW